MLAIDQPPVVEAVAPLPTPFRVFQEACLEGNATLDPDSVEAVKFRELPEDAQIMIRFALPLGSANNWSMRPPMTSQVMERIYRLAGESDAYLMLPDGTGDTGFANVCSVVVEGATFGDARGAILHERTSSNLLKSALGSRALPYVAHYADGYQLTAAEHNGWAIAATVPAQVPVGESSK